MSGVLDLVPDLSPQGVIFSRGHRNAFDEAFSHIVNVMTVFFL